MVSEATTTPRIAVLGAGNWGANHVRVWNELGLLRLVCDPDPTRLAHVRETYPGVETALTPEDVFGRRDIDAVAIATPASTHALLTIQALEAGLDVLVEKPMALSVTEAEKVIEVSARNRSILMVDHVLEYHPAVLKLRELIEEGELGKVLYLYSHRLNFGRVRTEENALWSFAPHDIALLLRLFGPPTEVSCQGGTYLTEGVADVTLMSLAFPGGVKANVFVSWLHPFKEHRFVVVGDRQMAVFDDTVPWEEKLVLYPHRVDWVSGRVPVARKAEAVRVALDQREALRAACEHFVECVITRRAPLTDATSGLEVLRVLEAAEQSIEQRGAPVRVGDGSGSSTFVHPSAAVDDGAELGEGTRIWHYSHVSKDALIGKGCVLGQNVFVGPRVRIGDGVKIQNNVSVYQDVELEDHVFCGPSAVFTNVINPRSEIERKHEFRRTLVKRGATIGANSTILCGNSIGRYAMVAAGAVVTRDVADYALVVGVPARPAGWVCECGENLEFEGLKSICASCGRVYVKESTGVVAKEAG